MAQGQLRWRVGAKGYKEFWDDGEQRWVRVHRRVAEKLFGELPPDVHVHHKNHDKSDNRPENLIPLKDSVHARLHATGSPNICFRCGREGHWARDCFANTLFNGEPLNDDDWG